MDECFDTHCHFETTDEKVLSATLARARAAGVTRILAVGGSPALNASAACAVRLGGGYVWAAFGSDRDQVDRASEPWPEDVSPVAVGEIGLDYHYSPETRRAQMDLFAAQLELARKRDLPVIIHTREAAADTHALLKETPSRGIIHSFTGTSEEAATYLDLGFYISISGIVTFKSADNVREMAKSIPADRLLIETDAPYLAPVPMRGRENESAFLPCTCEYLSRLRGVSGSVLAAQTTANGLRALGLAYR